MLNISGFLAIFPPNDCSDSTPNSTNTRSIHKQKRAGITPLLFYSHQLI